MAADSRTTRRRDDRARSWFGSPVVSPNTRKVGLWVAAARSLYRRFGTFFEIIHGNFRTPPGQKYLVALVGVSVIAGLPSSE
jgi:hypothetical protein